VIDASKLNSVMTRTRLDKKVRN